MDQVSLLNAIVGGELLVNLLLIVWIIRLTVGVNRNFNGAKQDLKRLVKAINYTNDAVIALDGRVDELVKDRDLDFSGDADAFNS